MVGARFECAFLELSFLSSHASFSVLGVLSCNVLKTIVLDHPLQHLGVVLSVPHLGVSECDVT